MSDLAEFLLARIAEDEETLATSRRLSVPMIGSRMWLGMGNHATVSETRLAAECEAKRRIVGEIDTTVRAAQGLPGGSGRLAVTYGIERMLRLLALPYADHPDFREEWRP